MTDAFRRQLDNFGNEARDVSKYIYADYALNHAASKSRVLLGRLNRTPTFWLATFSAWRIAAYVGLGRIFDRTSQFTLSKLVEVVQGNLSFFEREALAERKRDGRAEDPEWLTAYLDKAYYPNQRDVAWLRATEKRLRATYDRIIRPARNKHIAHREHIDPDKVTDLYSGGLVRELWQLSASLLELHRVLRELYHNGRRPRMRPVRYSPKAIFEGRELPTQDHERMVEEVRKLTELLTRDAAQQGAPGDAPK